MIKEIIKKVVSFIKKEKIEKKDTNLNEKTESENTQDRNNKKDRPPDDIYPLW